MEVDRSVMIANALIEVDSIELDKHFLSGIVSRDAIRRRSFYRRNEASCTDMTSERSTIDSECSYFFVLFDDVQSTCQCQISCLPIASNTWSQLIFYNLAEVNSSSVFALTCLHGLTTRNQNALFSKNLT